MGHDPRGLVRDDRATRAVQFPSRNNPLARSPCHHVTVVFQRNRATNRIITADIPRLYTKLFDHLVIIDG